MAISWCALMRIVHLLYSNASREKIDRQTARLRERTSTSMMICHWHDDDDDDDAGTTTQT
jgi:hypothetical protein